MAKTTAAEQIMPPEKMKPLLALSKQEPVQAAMGLTGEGEGVLLLDKRAKPKKVLALLRNVAGKAKVSLSNATLRFGRAEVDPDYDSAIVRLYINKEPPGPMRVKLTEVVKKTSYQKVEFIIDPALEEEAEDEADTVAASTEAAARADPVPPAPPLPPPEQNVAILNRALTQFAHRIGELPPAQAALRSALVKLAADANAAIKGGDLATAGAILSRVREALDRIAASASHVQEAAAPGAAKPTDYLSIFRDAKEEVDKGLNDLATALRQTEDPDLERIADFGLNGMTDGQGVGLMKALLELNAASPDRRAPLLKAAREAAAAYKSAVFADAVVDEVDANPFGVQVGIRAKLGAALDTIANAA